MRNRIRWLYPTTFAARDDGAAAVEFAILAPVMIVAFSGIVGYGMALLDEMDLVSATRSGAQLALIDSSDTSAIQNAVVAATGLGITTSDVTTTEFCECADGSTVTCGLTCSDGSDNRYFMTITATFDHTIFLIGNTVTLTGSTTVRTR
ncbi:MAG: TadE/TadG family type IV pilus assembly protein [Rhodospirillales bacterium]